MTKPFVLKNGNARVSLTSELIRINLPKNKGTVYVNMISLCGKFMEFSEKIQKFIVVIPLMN